MSHKFIAYREVEAELISAMRNNAHEVFYVTELDHDTSEDSICQKANTENYIILTGDKAFAQTLYDDNKIQSGIMLVDVHEDNLVAKAKVVLDAIDEHSAHLSGHYTTITKQKVKQKGIAGA